MTTNNELTKSEAIQAMLDGKKVAHVSFASDEWMRGRGADAYEFEDGIVCSHFEFWRWRTGSSWLTDWRVVE